MLTTSEHNKDQIKSSKKQLSLEKAMLPLWQINELIAKSSNDGPNYDDMKLFYEHVKQELYESSSSKSSLTFKNLFEKISPNFSPNKAAALFKLMNSLISYMKTFNLQTYSLFHRAFLDHIEGYMNEKNHEISPEKKSHARYILQVLF